MAKKFLLPLLGALLVLGACAGEAGQNSSSSSGSDSSSSGNSFEPIDWSGDGTTNEEVYDYDDIYVNTPTNELADDFAYGVDLSIVKEIEDLGGKYYDKDGNEQDVFKILKDGGSNYCRLRLWVDPYDADGNPYGGGTNDLETDIYLARRAATVGMKVCIDFHLSDSWCDPAKQYCPKAWDDLALTALPNQVGEYIKESLQAFKNVGVEVSSFQVGNETNSQIMGVSATTLHTLTSRIYTAGIEGGKEVFPDAKAIIHLTNVKSNATVKKYLDTLESDGVPYDIAGFSFYPYWHGTQSNLLDVLTYAANKGKETMIMETAWGFTDEQNEVVSNQYSSNGFGTTGGYETSTQAQATELADLVDVLSQVPNQKGTGLFYWEPAWLPTPGTGWVTRAGAFYNDYGHDPLNDEQIAIRDAYSDNYLKASWSNQAVFSYTGKVLPSAYTYKYIQEGTKTVEEEIVGLVSDKVTHTINLKDESTLALPTTVKMKTNLDAHRDVAVTWDNDQYTAMLASGDGEYSIDGQTSTGVDVTCSVTVETNFVDDPSFENQTGSGEEFPVSDPWSVTCDPEGCAWIGAKSEANRTGSNYFHWYHKTSTYTWDLSQTIEMNQSGTFALRTYNMSSVASTFESLDMYYQINDNEEVTMDALFSCQGWYGNLDIGMVLIEMKGIEITSGDTIKIGMRCSGQVESWGSLDDWSLVKYDPSEEPEEPTTTYGIQNASFEDSWDISTTSSPWSLTEGSSGPAIKDSEPFTDVDGAGSRYLNWWASSAFSFTLQQTFQVEESGTYTLGVYFVSQLFSTGYNSASISYQIGDETAIVTELDDTILANEITHFTKEGLEATADTDITISLTMDCKAGGWGRCDLWSFEKTA